MIVINYMSWQTLNTLLKTGQYVTGIKTDSRKRVINVDCIVEKLGNFHSAVNLI